jgi:hypothetical protein
LELAGLPIRLSHWGARLEGCPATLAIGTFFVQPCAGADAGVVSAASSEIAESMQSLDAVFLGRLAFSPHERLAIEVQAELGIPVINDRLGVLSSSGKPATVARAPEVAAALRLGVGTRFP